MSKFIWMEDWLNHTYSEFRHICVNDEVGFDFFCTFGQCSWNINNFVNICLCGVFCSQQAWLTLQDRQWSSCMRRMVASHVTFTSLPSRISRMRPTSSLLTKFAKVLFTFITLNNMISVCIVRERYSKTWFDTVYNLLNLHDILLTKHRLDCGHPLSGQQQYQHHHRRDSPAQVCYPGHVKDLWFAWRGAGCGLCKYSSWCFSVLSHYWECVNKLKFNDNTKIKVISKIILFNFTNKCLT